MQKWGFCSRQEAKFPPMVVVSVGNMCNYRCSHCLYPKYVRWPKYERHNMAPAVFHKIADEMAGHPESVLRLIAWGEPLLHPRLVDLVRYMNDVAPNNKITLITNGSLLTPKRSLALMRAGLDFVEVSLDANTDATYRTRRQTRMPGAFDRVRLNIRAILEQRESHGYDTKVVVSFIVWPGERSEREFSVFAETWMGVADDIVRRPLHSFRGTLPNCRPLPSSRPACRAMWTRCDITPWGEISVCYNDWERADILGDLNNPDVTIGAVWRSRRLEQLRHGQLGGEFQGICAKCQDYNPHAWTTPYENVIARALRPRSVVSRLDLLHAERYQDALKPCTDE